MAAQIEPIARGLELRDLRSITAAELSPILLEETVEWDQRLSWDFAKSADLVRRFTDMRALDGSVVIDRGEIIGYGYSVLEDHKGLIGDVYIREAWRNGDNEVRLFRSLLDSLMGMSSVRRIESQLMTVDRAVGKALQRERFIRIFERVFMMLDPFSAPLMLPRELRPGVRIDPWNDLHQESAAGIISLSYHDHIDSQINDQYRCLAGARRFLNNIVQFPGCGMFLPPASFVAVDLDTGWASGIVLASFISEGTGHITQLCVAPKSQGTGLGYELLRRSIDVLVRHGAKRISLTVTLDNKEALGLYERTGFADIHRFFAYVWESCA